MTTIEMERHIYNLYRVDWMITNGYSIDDLLVSVVSEIYVPDDYAYSEERERRILREVENWETDIGFGGDCWDSFKKFICGVFLNSSYIESLLSRDKVYGAELLPLYHKRLKRIGSFRHIVS